MRAAQIIRWFVALLAWISAASAIAASHTHPGALTAEKPFLYHVHGLSFSSDGKSVLVPSHYGPKDERSLVIATQRRHVSITNDGGTKWLQIAKDGDLP